MLKNCLGKNEVRFDHRAKDLRLHNSFGLDKTGSVGTLCLRVPFLLLSTRVILDREIEKRYLTPFGIVDLTFRAELDGEKPKSHLIIEVGGDAENWISCDDRTEGPTTIPIRLVWGIAKDHLTTSVQLAFNEVSIGVKGYEMDLKAPWGNTVFGEWKALKAETD